ncbi:hypothetical protein F9U64_10640 [Gracilibacillus oryzae]|uniref:Uncharacterized protein n=1 Tax=Gracilibacillus oryzae TaxID=1672701 RepID=A0A7C8GU21_9BACI|nr:hypothetical protein F9U64_10640 [Gracilibacillus oryzae]
MPIILSIILLIALAFSISVVFKKRKKAGITGIKSALTPICLYLIAVTNLLAYWFDFMGLINWTIIVILLILGAYFMKYMPASEQ